MLCDLCHKNIATVHLTEIVNYKIIEMHICQDCAQTKAEEISKQPNISEFLGGLADLGKDKSEEYSLKCSLCGLSYGDFRKTGRLGCAHCYVTFRKFLLPLLKKIHTSTRHAGKVPLHIDKDLSNEVKLKELRKQLQRAIKLEEYEDAARLRDEIKKIDKGKSEI